MELDAPGMTVDLSAVILAVTDEVPSVLAVDPAPRPGDPLAAAWTGSGGALPRGPLDLDGDRTLERGLRRWVADQTGVALGYVEQLYSFGDRGRDPREQHGGPRLVSVGYLALVRAEDIAADSGRWQPWYELFPWEDHRAGPPAILDEVIRPALAAWADEPPDDLERQARRDRVDINFACGGVEWDTDRALERYELLYEAGLVYEAVRDRDRGTAPHAEDLGRAMALDHRRIAATALGRVRGKIRYRPVIFELLPEQFTLLELQQVVEALAGVRLHKPNFRRLIERAGLVEGTGRSVTRGRGRPAELFRFRREVLRERLAPGVGLPRG